MIKVKTIKNDNVKIRMKGEPMEVLEELLNATIRIMETSFFIMPSLLKHGITLQRCIFRLQLRPSAFNTTFIGCFIDLLKLLNGIISTEIIIYLPPDNTPVPSVIIDVAHKALLDLIGHVILNNHKSTYNSRDNSDNPFVLHASRP